MIPVTDSITLDEAEIELKFVRAAGPGGQNVNKVATAVELRFDAARSPSIPDHLRTRLLRLAGSRATGEGEIVIHARRFRTQEANRRDAVDRLVDLIARAATPAKPRRPTRPSKGAKERRLQSKKTRGAVKRKRRPVSPNEE